MTIIDRRRFLKRTAAGLFVPATFGILVPRARGQALLRGRVRRGAAGGAPPTYLYEQNFDGAGTPSGWNIADGTPNYDYTTSPAPLEGTQSLRCVNDTAAYTDNFFDQAEVWGFFLWRPVANASSHDIFNFWDNATSECSAIEALTGTTALRIKSGTATADTVATYSTGITYRVWTRYKKGTGANAEADVWFSSTGTKPANGSNNHASLTTGTRTTNARRLFFKSQFTGSDSIFDQVRVDDVDIGSNPP